ncbi:chemotaxis protein CheB [Polymorphobacter sp.]|uniref:chemotaxis protein CheB n=1 Tax=Polymorphobacter sp. TaxID=1909290 RepID=UPI003F7060C8
MTDRLPQSVTSPGADKTGNSASARRVIAIGGSAGGLDAFRQLFDGLPQRSGNAYIVVQHLDAAHASMLAELLAADTPIPVVEVTDGMAVMADCIHVIPSGKQMSVSQGVLHLSANSSARGPRLPFDFLLQSLAQAHGKDVVAIVLSGDGADGSEGVRAVHAAGGLVYAQDPGEASHGGMPAAAIATGVVHAVLPIAAIRAAIGGRRDELAMASPKKALQKPDAPVQARAARPVAPDAHGWLATALDRLQAGGYDFRGYKAGTIQRRIERRALMAGYNANSVDRYVAGLASNDQELTLLANDLLINVTSFFRDEEVFATLCETILPDLVRNHVGDAPLRAWCAGCSTGEEAWSLAMVILEEIARTRPTLRLQMFATDLDPAAVAMARRGIYPSSIESRVSAERLKRFFECEGDEWHVGAELRSSVVFAVHDMLTDAPFSRIDLLSCRNLLIYLQPAAQLQATALFHFALRPGGLLLLGSAETVAEMNEGAETGFTLISKAARLYRRNVNRRVALPGQPAPLPAFALPPRPPLATPPGAARLLALEAELASIRAELASVNLHLEGAGIEQEAAHADTMSRNEEYQTTNEELLTPQEELQSLNEELVALNAQLQETLDRQRTTSDDLQNILYSTDVATIFLDREHNIRFFTPATRALFHLLPGDVGRPLADLAPLRPDAHLLSDSADVLTGSPPIEREIDGADGVSYCRRILPYRSHDEQIEGVVITYTDITERKQTLDALREARESAEAANLAKSRFLAAASHDLRQPLQALVLLQELLARKASDPETQVLLIRLDRTLDAMSSMLDSLLDINRIEAGAIEIESRAFPLEALFGEVVQGLMLQASLTGLKLRYVPTACHVVSDRRLLAQMLHNLVANALKYTNRGGVLIGARRRENNVEIQVWDTGIGIAAGDLESVFKPYSQLGDMPAERGRGLGLGLSIVQSLGDMLGHPIAVRSRPGRGSVFCITVPVAEHMTRVVEAKLVPGPRQRPDKAAPATTGQAAPANILVIDNDGDLLDLLGQTLRDAGHQVTTAKDESEAKAALKTSTPDLIISDLFLDGAQDGLELAATLRQKMMQTVGRLVPVMILTGDIAIHTLARVAAYDCTRLSKPVRPTELLAAVEAELGRASTRDATATDAQAEWGIVHVIDDDPSLLREFSLLMANAGLPARLHVSSEAFRASWEPEKAGCLLIDAYLPGESGIELLASLKAAGVLTPAILITGKGDVSMAVDAMKAGAMDFIEKPVRGSVIVDSVRRALESIKGLAMENAERSAAAARLATLTDRQVEVMLMVLNGQPSKNIAADLDISQRTVENHRAEIMRRTGCRSLPELARLVMTAKSGSATE